MNWSDSGNWATPLVDGSALTFAGTTQETNVNDILSGMTNVNLVTFANGGFNVSGQSLTLNAGMTSIGSNTWGINSTLSGSQSFTVPNACDTLTVSGAVNNNGYALTLNNTGALTLSRDRFTGKLNGTRSTGQSSGDKRSPANLMPAACPRDNYVCRYQAGSPCLLLRPGGGFAAAGNAGEKTKFQVGTRSVAWNVISAHRRGTRPRGLYTSYKSCLGISMGDNLVPSWLELRTISRFVRHVLYCSNYNNHQLVYGARHALPPHRQQTTP